jgi:hypothetical protein
MWVLLSPCSLWSKSSAWEDVHHKCQIKDTWCHLEAVPGPIQSLMVTMIVTCKKVWILWQSSFYDLLGLATHNPTKTKAMIYLVIWFPRECHLLGMLADLISLSRLLKTDFYKRWRFLNVINHVVINLSPVIYMSNMDFPHYSSLKCTLSTHRHNLRDRLAGAGQTDFFHASTVEELIFIK